MRSGTKYMCSFNIFHNCSVVSSLRGVEIAIVEMGCGKCLNKGNSNQTKRSILSESGKYTKVGGPIVDDTLLEGEPFSTVHGMSTESS